MMMKKKKRAECRRLAPFRSSCYENAKQVPAKQPVYLGPISPIADGMISERRDVSQGTGKVRCAVQFLCSSGGQEGSLLGSRPHLSPFALQPPHPLLSPLGPHLSLNL